MVCSAATDRWAGGLSVGLERWSRVGMLEAWVALATCSNSKLLLVDGHSAVGGVQKLVHCRPWRSAWEGSVQKLVREQTASAGSSHWCRLKQGEKDQASLGPSVARPGRLAWLLGPSNVGLLGVALLGCHHASARPDIMLKWASF